MNEPTNSEKLRNKGSGDPIQRAAREVRIKQSLRDNLRRRKLKAKAMRKSDDESASSQ